MCQKGQCCQNPVQLKGKPGECSPQQVKECHGDQKGHTCENDDKSSKE